MSRISRRRFLGAVGLGGLASAGAGYAHFVESEWLEVGRHDVPLSRGAKLPPLKIAQLGDLHLCRYIPLEYIARAVKLALECKPDLICLTGDYVTGFLRDPQAYSNTLAPLTAAAPTFACLGNHDGGPWTWKHYKTYRDTTAMTAMLEGAGVIVLENRWVQFAGKDWRLNLVGTPDLGTKPDVKQAFSFAKVPPSQRQPGEATILLAHDPDSKDHFRDQWWDLQLSGHTHGGQICLPLLGAPILPTRDKRFASGLHRWENRWLHVTKGVGNRYGIRFNCRPEISLLTLV